MVALGGGFGHDFGMMKVRHVMLCGLLWLVGVRSMALDRYEQAPINYSGSAASNVITRLAADWESGRVRGGYGSEREFLDFLMERLEVPAATQTLVFSKTSLQIDRIGPLTPRALYFNDDLYLGWVPGGAFEVAVQDDTLGMVFYKIHSPGGKGGKMGQPVFHRDNQCLSCHGGSRSHDVPGVMIRSVFPDASGHPIGSAGSFLVGHETPLSQRWGGWYVTGFHGELPHMGNRVADEVTYGNAVLRSGDFMNVSSLAGLVSTRVFPATGSDIVALMVMEHQVNMHNLLNLAAMETRIALHREEVMGRVFGGDEGASMGEGTVRILNRLAERVVAHMLYAGEAPLPEEGIQGDPAFVASFQRNARRDDRGRSLKDFHLADRLFRYRCSYMIYSHAFATLPPVMKDRILARLLFALTAEPSPVEATHLSSIERTRILEILRATLDDLPAAWRAVP